jgi:hypothetical protein
MKIPVPIVTLIRPQMYGVQNSWNSKSTFMERLEQIKFEECLLPFNSLFFLCVCVCFCIFYRNVKIWIYKTLILLVLYGCETWYFNQKGVYRWKVSENRVLRRMINGLTREVTEGWGKLHIEKLRNLCWANIAGWSDQGGWDTGMCSTDGRNLKCK